MIYSEAFDNLPAPAKDAIYKRMWESCPGPKTRRSAHACCPRTGRLLSKFWRDYQERSAAYFGKP